MFTLIKLVFELLFAGALFVGGILFTEKYPSAAARISAMVKALWTKKAA